MRALTPPSAERLRRLDWALLAALLLGAVIAGYKLALQLAAGPRWDTYAFAANAAALAGRSIGYVEPWRQPVLSLLTAPLMAVGGLEIGYIQFVDALVALSGAVAIQRLFRHRLSPAGSVVASVLWLAAPMTWAWVGVGYTDVAAVAFSAWTLLFLWKATEENPRWYWAAIPMLVVVAMTRHAGLLFALPAAGWVLLRWRPFRQARHVAQGVLLAILAYVPAAGFYLREFDDVLFPFSVALGIFVEQAARGSTVTAEPGVWSASLTLPLLLVAWLALTGLGVRARAWLSRTPFAPPRWLLAAAAAAPAVVAQVANAGLAARQVTIVGAVVFAWTILAEREEQADGAPRIAAAAALDAVVLAWTLVYLDHYLHHPVELPRYLIPAVPGVAYFMLLGMESWRDRVTGVIAGLDVGPRLREGNRVGLWVVLAPVALLAIALLGVDIAQTPREVESTLQAHKATASWLAEHADSLGDGPGYSDVWPMTSWYTQSNVTPMPSFESTPAYPHQLQKTSAAYYVTFGDGLLGPEYEEAFRYGDMRVMVRVAEPGESLPRIAYLGDAWENYLEGLAGYRYFLFFDSGPFAWGRSAYLDGQDASELSAYDAVAVYGVRWRDLGAGEAVLEEYASAGGSVVIDASGNLDSLSFPLIDRSLLEMLIRRSEIPEDARISVESGLASRYPELASIEASRFVGEGGGPWYGATYSPLPEAGETRVLATAGGVPIVTVQEVGLGSVWWIGGNLAWHAHVNENGDEAKLIEAVLEEAVSGRASSP